MNDSGPIHTSRSALMALSALLIAGIGAGCGKQTANKRRPSKAVFTVSVKVEDAESGAGVPRAPVKIDGNTVGYTDAKGKFVGKLEERPGKKVKFEIGKIDGYRFVGSRSMTDTLDLKKGLDGKRNPVPVILQTTVRSIRKPYLIWVRAHCNEETAGRTRRQGRRRDGLGRRRAPEDRTATAIEGESSDRYAQKEG
ncbi:MAG: hypothetical protein ABEL76_14155 [Bradymonadaceae bacterium]